MRRISTQGGWVSTSLKASIQLPVSAVDPRNCPFPVAEFYKTGRIGAG
jgi:hypothetical protein